MGHKKYYSIHLIFIVVLVFIMTALVAIDVNAAGGSDINKAIPLFIKKQYKAAKKIFLKVLKEEPNNIVARYYIAEIMFTDVRRYDDAAKQFELVLKMSEKKKSSKFRIRNKYILVNSMLKLGLVHLKNGQNITAIEYLKAFLENDEGSQSRIAALNSLAVAYSNLDDYESAINYLEQSLQLDKDNLLARFNLSAINSKLIYYNTGLDLSIKSMHQEAAREFVKALDVDPFFVAAHFRLGLEHKKLRNYIDAQNELMRAYAINPDYVYSYRVLEQIADIYVRLNDFENARKYIDKSVALNDKYPYTINILGMINMNDGNYEEAIQNFKKASDLKFVPEFMENLGKAQKALIKKARTK